MAMKSKSNNPEKKQQVSQSYFALVWWKFKKNKMAIIGGVVLILIYLVFFAIPEFMSPYELEHSTIFNEAPPTPIHFIDAQGHFSLRPFVYGLTQKMDVATRVRSYVSDTTLIYPIHFIVKGDAYKWLGFIPLNIHLFGLDQSKNPDAYIFLFGTDSIGRDYFSRVLYGGRLSLMIGLLGVIMTLVFGSILGAISGYYGGVIDMIVQRTTEFLNAFPDIPLFMALAAAIPQYWPPAVSYFMLTVILSFVRWGGLARQVRGLILSLREREYVLAAKSAGAGDSRIMFRHLLPGAMSHIIVIATLAIPGMILSETALSWLGLGLRPPLTSWGVLLFEGGTVRAIRYAPWLLWVIPWVIITVLAFNMLGDGLRDALDPYAGR
jgi:peptide/nickel transport system permease protein